MHFRNALALVAMPAASLAAQVYQIDPNTVPLATRTEWCVSSTKSCPLLCLQNPKVQDATTISNTCDPSNLNYSCICGNGIQPDLGNFSLTIPFFECQEYGNQCVASCGSGNIPCQSACRDNNPCGAQNPTRINTTSSSTLAPTGSGGSATSSGPVIYTGLGGSSASTTKTNDKSSASKSVLLMGQSYGLAVVFAGIFTGFALVL